MSLFCLLNTGNWIENNQGEEGKYQETRDEAGNCVINNGVTFAQPTSSINCNHTKDFSSWIQYIWKLKSNKISNKIYKLFYFIWISIYFTYFFLFCVYKRGPECIASRGSSHGNQIFITVIHDLTIARCLGVLQPTDGHFTVR